MKKIFLLALAVVALACTKDPNGEDGTPKDRSIHGYAQKGQFVKGSQVTAFAIGKDLIATGESFPANISDDLGAFSISGKTGSPYLELRAEGYYFNEIEGAVSSSPLYLEAFVKSSDATANVNLMTTAIRPRIKKYLKDGKDYDEALFMAQSDFLMAMDFPWISVNFDDMDITGTKDEDALLLAFACLMQSGRTAAEVTTLIQEVASDLESKGTISPTVLEKVKSRAENVNPFAVIENLAKYYKEKGLSVNSVPAFWKYIDKRYNAPFLIVDYQNFPFYPNPGNVVSSPYKPADAIVSGMNVLASIDFTVEVDVEGATTSKEQILGPAYHISFQIPANEGDTDRTVNVIFKDATGKVLDQREYEQGANVQYIIIPEGGGTKSDITISDGTENSPFKEGVEISVNGKAYKLQRFSNFYNALGVAVPKEQSYIVTYPVGKVSAGEHIIRAKTTVNANQTTSQEMYYYGALASYDGMDLGNPAQVRMMPCFALIRFKPHEAIKHIEVCPADGNQFFSGTASFVVYKNDVNYFPDVNPNIAFDSGASQTITIDNPNSEEYVSCVTFPQPLNQGLQIKYRFEVNGVSTENSVTISNLTDIKAGYLYTFKLDIDKVQW